MRRTPSITRRERMTPHASASSGTTGSGAKLAGLSPDEVAGAAAARRHQLPAPAHQHCDRTAMRALSDTVVSRVNDDHSALVARRRPQPPGFSAGQARTSVRRAFPTAPFELRRGSRHQVARRPRRRPITSQRTTIGRVTAFSRSATRRRSAPRRRQATHSPH